MAKRTIRLNENQLHNIIKEAVVRMLNEEVEFRASFPFDQITWEREDSLERRVKGIFKRFDTKDAFNLLTTVRPVSQDKIEKDGRDFLVSIRVTAKRPIIDDKELSDFAELYSNELQRQLDAVVEDGPNFNSKESEKELNGVKGIVKLKLFRMVIKAKGGELGKEKEILVSDPKEREAYKERQRQKKFEKLNALFNDTPTQNALSDSAGTARTRRPRLNRQSL